MNKLISFSSQTNELIEQLSQAMNDPILANWNKQDKVLQAEIVAWLNKKIDHDKQSRFLVESLRAALLEDIANSFLSEEELEEKKKQRPLHQPNKRLFVLLSIAGTMVALCDGFGAIASILGSFMEVPTAVFILAGLGFSLLSVAIFYFVDLVDIAKTVGVKLGKSTQLLDVFLQQVEQINKIKKHIDDCYVEESTDASQRQALQELLAMLITRYGALDESRDVFRASLNNKTLVVAKYVTAGITAAFFFGGGFFSGQTLALAVAGLFVAGVSATAWPIVLASTIVALAAFSLYWFLQRPALDNIVGYWMGLDKDRIDALVSDEVVSQEKLELNKLSTKVARLDHLMGELEQSSTLEKKTDESTVPQMKHPKESTETLPGHHSFFKRPRSQSLNDLNDPLLLGLGVA